MRGTALVLDDLRSLLPTAAQRYAEVIYARTAQRGTEVLREFRDSGRQLDALWLDHDLGDGQDAPVVTRLLQEWAFNGAPLPIDIVYVHTANAVGRDRLMSDMGRYYIVRAVNCADFLTAE